MSAAGQLPAWAAGVDFSAAVVDFSAAWAARGSRLAVAAAIADTARAASSARRWRVRVAVRGWRIRVGGTMRVMTGDSILGRER
ncbi:hypothetical protein D3C85_1250100 [compost metagenome]